MSKVLSLLHWPVPLRTILFNCLLVFYLNLPEKCNKHWVILPCIQYLPPYRFNYRHYTNDIDNMVSQKIFTLLIFFSNLYLISSNVTINIWKWLSLFSECHFLKFYTIMKQEFLWNTLNYIWPTNGWEGEWFDLIPVCGRQNSRILLVLGQYWRPVNHQARPRIQSRPPKTW